MKLAFSTLGCPNWSWSDMISTAKDLGFDGIEVRGIAHQLFAPKALPFTPENIEATKSKLNHLNLEISCLSSACYLFDQVNLLQHLSDGKEYIDLASNLGVKYVRVLGDKEPHVTEPVDMNAVREATIILADYAKSKDVTILIETNGVFANSATMKAFIGSLKKENVGVLWDIHHPFTFMNETLEHTYDTLKSFIKYIHVKDSVVVNGTVIYKMLGEGTIPIKELIKYLSADQYDGYVVLEWTKRWQKDLEDPGIVFPHFMNTIKSYQVSSSNVLTAKGLVKLTMGDLIDQVADAYPNHEGVAYGDQDYRKTYGELRDEINQVAKGFMALGIKKGDSVAVWATNYPEWITALFATAKIGAVLVTVNTNYKIYEAEYLLKQSDSTTLILMDGFKDTNYVEILNKLCPELSQSEPGKLNSVKFPYLKNIIYLDNATYAGMYHWKDLTSLGKDIPDEDLFSIQRSLDPDDIINMQYTSGTTGFPKGVMLTHYNIVNNGKNIGDCMHFTKDDRLCIPVPFFHCFGLVLGLLACVTHGSTMVPVDHYNPEVVMSTLDKEKCTACHGVPTMWIAMLNHPNFKNYDFTSLRTGIMAGSPCPEKAMRQVVEDMGCTEITIAYGQTEAAPVCTQSKADDSIERKVTTVGRALPFVECKVVDPETGETSPYGIQGEFVARGYNVMKGYYKMPEATSAAIDENGWLHTGDLATMDEEGYYKITGRIKDMIIRGGENIYPKEIEEFLYTVDGILDVQVIGIPDKEYNEVVGAFVILKEGSTLTVDNIKDEVRTHMARHKVPKHIFFTDSFPMTASGKIQKFKLRDLAVETLQLSEDDLNATV
ncbi:MAG: AMP-dependent synthetase [Firmicutes bacterium HGW-Firmicutes-1]|jgi:fatty-acyl-CoA synthase|nr:MAG: AMP-dependent synthetase [Firmicutes bacterium HGW-Firmicutes-1]